MNKINVDKIIENTNNKIGISRFMNEEHSKQIIHKRMIMSISIFLFLFTSLATVNALTDNGIIKLFTKPAIINGKEEKIDSYINNYEIGDCVDEKCHLMINKIEKQDLCVKSDIANQEICVAEVKEITSVEMNYDENTKHPIDCKINFIDINDNEQELYFKYE